MIHFHFHKNKLASHKFMILCFQKWKIFQQSIWMISSCVKESIKTLKGEIIKSCIQFTAFLWTQYLISSSEKRKQKGRKKSGCESLERSKRWWLWMIGKHSQSMNWFAYVLIYCTFIFIFVLFLAIYCNLWFKKIF